MRENKANSNKAKSPVKRKSKLTNCGSRENQKRKKFLCDNFDEDEKEQLKKVDKKRTKCVITQRRKKKNIHKKRITKKKGKHDNLGNNQKEQLRKNEKRVKKVIHVNSGDEKRVYKKEEDKKEKIMITLMIVKKN